ncbi:Macrophage mannose receptor 1 [Merluccius polli]|uniref:Macrophage mannose receptor 1 n=1 Tax=Merluccius polli TaxID=89951 RepID=A0AA47N100_MERPO|nr:Macrophage mannose receptor 1 [Merluccius polli]
MRKNILLFLSLSGHLLGYHASPPVSKTYYYVDQKLGWAHAQQHCREHFEDLATVDNVEELQRLQESRNGFEYDNNFMWIGLYDDRTSWQWSLGNQNYKYGQHYGIWLSGNPDFWDCKENCTVMTSWDGKWSDSKCNELHSALCVNDEGNYIIVQEKMNWEKAQQYCQSSYVDLANAHDATENSKLFALVGNTAWIGLHRYPWSHWSDGSRATLWNWRLGEPNSFGGPIGPRCVTMEVTSGDFLDNSCDLMHNFACQITSKRRSNFKLKISSDADMTDPEVARQIMDQLYVKLAQEGVTGKISWVLKDGQVFHKDQET